MILVLVIGLWTFLRAVLFGSAAIALEPQRPSVTTSTILPQNRHARGNPVEAGVGSTAEHCAGRKRSNAAANVASNVPEH